MKECTKPEQAVPQIQQYSIGPFAFDEQEETITLQPGAYLLTEPITFGRVAETRIVGVNYDAAPHGLDAGL